MQSLLSYRKTLGVLLLLAAIALHWETLFLPAPSPSQAPLTVVLPTAGKDVEVLPFAVASIRQYLQHPIEKIVILAPKSSAMWKLCRQLQVECLDENRVYSRKRFMRLVQKSGVEKVYTDRSGSWFYQQLLKLSYARFSPTDDYFIMDADIVLQRPLILKTDQGVYRMFRVSGKGKYNKHSAYLCGVNQLFGWDLASDDSYVGEMMLFHKQTVEAMMHAAEAHTKQSFAKAMLDVSNKTPDCRFSEYETYGYYAAHTQAFPIDRYYVWGILRHRQYLQESVWWQKFFQFLAYHDWVSRKTNHHQ